MTYNEPEERVMKTGQQLTLGIGLVEGHETASISARTPTFVDNMKLPVHGWFRFSAGFSAAWATSIIRDYSGSDKTKVVLDPFAGVGTTLLAAEEAGVRSYGIEAQPFIKRIAESKLLWSAPPEEFLAFAEQMLQRAHNIDAPIFGYPSLITRCYPPDTLDQLHRLKTAYEEIADNGPASELAWLALVATLRISSPVGTAPWQYILPKVKKVNTPTPFHAFAARVTKMASDMRDRQGSIAIRAATIIFGDARTADDIEGESVDFVVTSPPYANNYDYADATRLEMTFFGDVTGWGELHKVARRHLVRSCSQHVSIDRLNLVATLETLSETPIYDEISTVCRELEQERLKHGGKKDYHLMIAAYFSDLYAVWKTLRRVCKPASRICFVIGDSAPYGVYAPVHEWLGKLALTAGFSAFNFEKIRDRNVKWKNRKHRVPLQEGHLWVEG